MKLVISIDVEEEGLFFGRYPRTPPGVTNVAELSRLEFIPRDFGLPLTLLVTYQVARDPAACRVLAHWRDRYGAEIGLHLHPWNTPPFADLPDPEPVRSERLPRGLLRDKFANLTTQVKDALAVTPRSFRMGRFDAGPQVFSLLPEFGLEVDSSVAPLTRKNPDPRFFLAPADPFPLGDAGPAGQPLLEVPITMVPVVAGTPALVARLAATLPPAWGAPPPKLLPLWGRRRGAAGLVSSGVHATGGPPPPPSGGPGAHPVFPLLGTPARGQPALSHRGRGQPVRREDPHLPHLAG